MSAAVKLAVAATTAQIVEANMGAPLHLWLTSDLLAQQPVSRRSVWGSDRWALDNLLPGASDTRSTFVWNIDLPDGTNLLDQKNAALIDWLRRLLWSAIASPGEGRTMRPSSVGSFNSAVRYWVKWLVGQGIRWPSEIDKTAVDEFVEHLQAEAEYDDVSGLTEATAYHRLRPFQVLWRQRYALAKAGIVAMPTPPFGGEGIVKVSKRVSAIASGSFRPLPDEVAIPVMNTAMEMLGVPAADVLALSEACSTAYSSAPNVDVARERQAAAADGFKFSVVNGRAWHLPLNPEQWKPEIIETVEVKLRAYLRICQTAWESHPILSDIAVNSGKLPTLPTSKSRSRLSVDLVKASKEIGLSFGEERMLTGHRRCHYLLSKAALEQGLAPPPFISSLQRVRQLILAIRSACQIVIQATTGMRISEICSLKGRASCDADLPPSVTVREGIAGITEIFVVTSDLTKTEHGTPRAVPWVLGYRPMGSTDFPPAVKAMLITDKMFASLRSMSGIEALFLGFRTSNGTPKKKNGVAPITSNLLRESMQSFICEWVDLQTLPNDAERKSLDNELVAYRETRGRIIKTHQLRKCFGYFASNIDRRLLPVLQMNFHHVSAGMTDGAYTGNPIIERDANDVRYQNCAFELLEIARGSRGMTGRYGEQLERKIIDELGPRIGGKSTEQAYLESYIYVAESRINRMFFTAFGDCGAYNVGASSMACHDIAGTTDSARWEHRLTPNWQTRRPSVCAGCACFAMSRRHRPYWEQRYIDNATLLRVFAATGRSGPLVDGVITLTTANMEQALNIATKLGAERLDLDNRVQHAVQESINAS